MPYRPRNKKVLKPPFKVPGGFRFIKGTGPKVTKGFVKKLEKQEVLTDLQNKVIEIYLKKLNETFSPAYIAKIVALTEKPIIKAKVDKLGNSLPKEEKEKKEINERKK